MRVVTENGVTENGSGGPAEGSGWAVRSIREPAGAMTARHGAPGLARPRHPDPGDPASSRPDDRDGRLGEPLEGDRVGEADDRDAPRDHPRYPLLVGAGRDLSVVALDEIGRASCRERV